MKLIIQIIKDVENKEAAQSIINSINELNLELNLNSKVIDDL